MNDPDQIDASAANGPFRIEAHGEVILPDDPRHPDFGQQPEGNQ